jgi:hypothetical protein
MWVSVLFHDVFGGINVVYAEVCGWESLYKSLSVSSMVRDKGIRRLGSLGGEVCCCRCSCGCIFLRVVLGVVKLGACVRPFGGVRIVGWGRKYLSGEGCLGVVVGIVRVR